MVVAARSAVVPQARGGRTRGARWWPVLGAVYFVVAVKRVRGMRLVGMVRKQRRQPLAAPAVVANRRRDAVELEH